MQPMWHGVFAIALIALFFSIVGLIAYQLYGTGIHFEVPDYFLPSGWATTTGNVERGDLFADYSGTLFVCESEKALKAEFLERNVRLMLSDGRVLNLPQMSSADGAYYANTDGSFVFWNKGITASVEESGTQTYTSCLQQ